MGVPQTRCMVFQWENPIYKWMMTGATPRKHPYVCDAFEFHELITSIESPAKLKKLTGGTSIVVVHPNETMKKVTLN